MKITHVQPPAPFSLTPRQIAFAVFSAIAGIWLMVYYVQLLNEAIARGERFRYEQQSSAFSPKSEPKVITVSFGS